MVDMKGFDEGHSSERKREQRTSENEEEDRT